MKKPIKFLYTGSHIRGSFNPFFNRANAIRCDELRRPCKSSPCMVPSRPARANQKHFRIHKLQRLSRIYKNITAYTAAHQMSLVEDKMKEREAQKQKQKQKLAATPGYNELDEISQLALVPNISGAIGRSRPLCIDGLDEGGRFPPCRTTLYPPSTSSVPKVSNAAPPSSLIMEHVYGYRGNEARDNARWWDAETLVYHAGATAIVHNVVRNRQQHYTAHNDDITSLALCLKPRLAASGQCGKVARIQIWEVDSCTTVSTIANPAIQRRIVALSWSRSGSHLVAVAGDDNRTAFVFSFARKTSASQVYKENIKGSTSKDVAENASRQPSLIFWSPVLLFSVPLQPADVFSVQFNPFSGNDGAGEFWAVGDKMVKSCDILARSCSKGIFGGNGVLQSALSVTFSSAPSFVITGMADGDIYFWSAGSLITRNQSAHPGGVTCVAWFTQMSDKGPVSRLISGGKDEYLRLWDMSDRVASLTATLQSKNPQPFPLISKFFFAPLISRSLGTRAAVVSLDYRQESDCVAVGTSKNSLFTVELSAFIPAQSPSSADAPAAHRALAKNLMRILSSGHSGEIGALAMVTWQGLQCAVTASMDGTVRLWDMRERKEVASAQLPAPIRCTHCSSDGILVAFGHSSGLLSVFKTADLLNSPSALDEASASRDDKADAMFWRAQPGTVTTANLFSGTTPQHAGSKTKSSASAAVASELGAVRGCVYVGIHRRECVTDVKFSPCGRYLVSASRDNFLDLYSVGFAAQDKKATSLVPSISASIAASISRSHSASEVRSGKNGGDMFWRPQSASQKPSLSHIAESDDFDATLPPRVKSSSAVLSRSAPSKSTPPSPSNVASTQRYVVKRIGVCSGHSSYLTHVDFSRDSTLMRSSDGANEVLFWGVPDCVQNPRTISLKDIKWATSTVVYGWDVRSIWPSGSDGTDINAVDVTRDGDAIITADDNGHVKLFRYPAAGDGQVFKAYLGHSSHVLNARFSFDGHRAFTCGGMDAAVIQWRHCDRAFAAPDDFNMLDPKSIPTHVFTVIVHSGPDGGSFDSLWIELIAPNIRSSRQTLVEKSAIKDALNLSTDVTSLPKSSSSTYTISVPSTLVHVIRLGVGFMGKSSSFCDIQKIQVISPSGQESVFYVQNCLDCNMTDAELLPGIENCVKLTLHCVTGDVSNAGTGGSVCVCLFDTEGKSSGIRCLRTTEKRTLFQRQQTDVFEIFCNPPIGPVSSLNVLLEPKGVGSDWYLEKFVLLRPKSSTLPVATSLSQSNPAALTSGDQDVVYFAAHSWLNTDFPSLKIQGSSADVVFNYIVAVNTADCAGAGTDASISLEFKGEHGSSGFRVLEQSTANELNLFERGKTNKFVLKLGRSLGLLKFCSVSMKATGMASIGVDWLLDMIVITDETSKEEYVFPFYQWLTPSDGVVSAEMSREINEYAVAIRTGNAFGAGTDANVWFEIVGDARSSKRRRADDSSTHVNKFERGNEDVFSVKVGPSLGEVTFLKVGFDASGVGADWLLDSVTVTHVQSKKVWMFIYQKELNSSNRSVELVATSDALKETYLLTVVTGDALGAGTDSSIFARLVGSDYSSYETELVKSLQHMDKFERAQTDTFELVLPRHLGVIQHLEIRFSPAAAALGAKWLLDTAKVCRKGKPSDISPDAIPEVIFIANRWMNAEKNRLVLEATNPADICEYDVSVWTGDEFGAGTDGSVYLTLTGDAATSDETPLEASMTYTDKFERGHEDKFVISTPKPLGSNLKCTVRFKPPAIGGSSWLLSRVNVAIRKFPKSYTGDLSWEYPCNRWFSKTLLSMDLASGKGFVYLLSVFTGNKTGAGTDANVHMEMWDVQGVSSGRHTLETSKTHVNKFEKGQCDIFHVTVPKKLGKLMKLLIGHDNSALAGNDWFLDRVEVAEFSPEETSAAAALTQAQAASVVFPCFRWLKHPDLEVTLAPGVAGDVHTYTVRVWTGDEPDCGTDANIRIELFEMGGRSSGVHKLAKSFEHLDKFERGNYDTFKLEVPGELGDLVSVKIYSDIDKDHWLLNKIVVWDNYACATSCNTPGISIDETTWADSSKSVLKANHPHRWLFPLKSWITSSDTVSIDAVPVNSTVDRKKADGVLDEPPFTTYDVAVFTGDLKDAAASGPVSIKLIGAKSASGRQILKLTTAGTSAKFERGSQELFTVQSVKDLGTINSVWVSHDPGISLLGSTSWYLDYIIVKCGQGEGTRFNCRRWLDKVSREVTLQPHSSADSIYIVRVVTSDEQDAGTNSNVFLEMFFENGQLPIQKLAQSEHRDKFERGQTDTFEILVPQSLKDLRSIAISSDGSGFGSKWLLSHVEVEISGKGLRTMFPCGQWLQKTRLILAPGNLRDIAQADGAVVSSVKPVVFKYTVLVETGDVVMAGTDANVMVTIFGSKAKLEEKKLSSSKTFMDKFERGHVDVFEFEEGLDLGDIQEIFIRHDNSALFGSNNWYLESVTVQDQVAGKAYKFLCREWLKKTKDLKPERLLKAPVTSLV